MRVAITTLGCKVNQYDTAVMERLFAERRWRRVAFDESADAYVVNSCTVTDRADADARRLARRARRNNPRARVILTGCYAQTSPSAISQLDYVDYVIGLGRLPDLLAAVAGELEDKVAVSDLRHAAEVATLGIESFPGRTRAFVKVQEGCNLFCTFCIVPVARGRSRSVAPRDVVSEIGRLEGRGYREVVLTGVHLGGYGDDLEPPCDLAWLLAAIAERRPSLRVRVSSIDPPELSARLVDVLANGDVFCPHLHVPVQAGDDEVLAHMKRRYTTAEAMDALERVRERIPDVCIGTDLITGFPGETDEQFERGLAWVEKAGFSYLHVFPYSQRSSTSAAKRWQPLPGAVVRERARRMRALDRRLRRRFQARFIGKPARMLFEGTAAAPSRKPRAGVPAGFFKGYSEHYLPLVCAADPSALGRVRTVRVLARRGAWLEARLA